MTAVAEFLRYLQLWLGKGRSAWLPMPGMASLPACRAAVAEPAARGRLCGLFIWYRGAYVGAPLLWLIDRRRPSAWNLAGARIAVAGIAIIPLGRKPD